MSPTYGKRTVLLRGADHIVQVEGGVAAGAIKPGYLVDGISSVVAHATAGGVAPKAIALERDEFGTGVDSTYTTANSGTGSPDYAIGDQVKVALCHPGVQFLGWVASGQVLVENDRLESAGTGAFRKFASGTILARVLETISPTSLTLVKMEFM